MSWSGAVNTMSLPAVEGRIGSGRRLSAGGCPLAVTTAYSPPVSTPDEDAGDEALMLAYRDGDAAAFDRLYERHRGGVSVTCCASVVTLRLPRSSSRMCG